VVDETWLSIDLPILTAIVELEAAMNPGVFEYVPDRIIEQAGIEIDSDGYIRSLVRLAGGSYLDVEISRYSGGGIACEVMGALERGRRVTGQWPPDDAYLSFISLLQERIDAAPDEPTRSRLRTALDAFLGVGRDIGVDLAAEWLKRMSIG
jgi:hypothetical protein